MSNVTRLFDEPETTIEFIDRLGSATADQVAKRFGREVADVRKELNAMHARGELFATVTTFSGWSDGIASGGRVRVYATSFDRLPPTAAKTKPSL
jgi:hypothetical protein